MKDLLEKIVAFLPNYFLEFGELISGPKVFISAKFQNSEERFVSALIFAAITCVIFFIIFSRFLQGGDLWINLATFFIWNCLGICLTAASVIIAWRLVGWSGSHKQIFVVIIYYNVAMSTIVAAFSLTAFGIFKVFIPEFYEIIFNTISKADFDFSEKLRNLVESYRGSMLRLMIPVFVGQALLVAGFILQYVWLFIGWGAFREMNGRTKARSGWAYFITMLINIPATAVMFFVMAATTQ